MIKNPKWQEATSWLFSKRGRVESETTENKFWPEVRTGFGLDHAFSYNIKYTHGSWLELTEMANLNESFSNSCYYKQSFFC